MTQPCDVPSEPKAAAAQEPAPRVKMTLAQAARESVLTAEDVADLAKLSPFTVYRSNKIPGRLRGIGRAVRFSAAVVVAWINGETAASEKRSR